MTEFSTILVENKLTIVQHIHKYCGNYKFSKSILAVYSYMYKKLCIVYKKLECQFGLVDITLLSTPLLSMDDMYFSGRYSFFTVVLCVRKAFKF